MLLLANCLAERAERLNGCAFSGSGSNEAFESDESILDIGELIHDKAMDVIVLVFVKHFMLLLLMCVPAGPPRKHTVSSSVNADAFWKFLSTIIV